MVHGTGDTTQGAPESGTAAGQSAPARGGTSRVATGRFATARGAGDASRGAAGAGPRGAGAAAEREREARVAHALRVAEGEDEPQAGTDWHAVGMFGAGLAIGVLLGAGTALLLAPASGFETRMRLVHSARETGDRLRRGARRGSRDLRRGVTRKLTRGRWAAEDAIERRLRRGEY